MYTYDAVPDAVAQVDQLPVSALSAYSELIAFLELTPWEGAPYREDKPDGPMRTMPFGQAWAWLLRPGGATHSFKP